MPGALARGQQVERALSISPLSLLANAFQANEGDDGWRQFAQLVGAVNAGNLPSAQKAYANFSQSSAADVAQANPESRLAQALSQIGQALQAGDVTKAQQALSSIRPRPQPESATADASPAQSDSPVDPNAPGAKLDLTV